MKINKIELSKKFSECLMETIGKKNYEKTIELNNLEDDKNICHSHDFCDANMVMLDAVKSFGLTEDEAMKVMLNDNVVNQAWTYWKQGGVSHENGLRN